MVVFLRAAPKGPRRAGRRNENRDWGKASGAFTRHDIGTFTTIDHAHIKPSFVRGWAILSNPSELVNNDF